MGDLPQSFCAVLVALPEGSGELPHPKSVPVADCITGVAVEKPVCGVATAGSLVFQAFDAHGSVETLEKVD